MIQDYIINTYIIPLLLAGIGTGVGAMVNFLAKHFHVQALAASNQNIQTAVQNFAGGLVASMKQSGLSWDDIAHGKANDALMAYLENTMAQSLDRVQLTPGGAFRLLMGKIGPMRAAAMALPEDQVGAQPIPPRAQDGTAGPFGPVTDNTLGMVGLRRAGSNDPFVPQPPDMPRS